MVEYDESKVSPRPWKIKYTDDTKFMCMSVIVDSEFRRPLHNCDCYHDYSEEEIGHVIAIVSHQVPPLVGTETNYEDNVAHIVACVNTHDQLTALVGDLVVALENVNSCLIMGREFGHRSIEWDDLQVGVEEALTRAAAVVPKPTEDGAPHD